MVIEAYSPLGTGRTLGDRTVAEIAERLGRTPAQVLIRWSVQRELVVLPKSTHRERIAQNAQAFDVTCPARTWRRSTRWTGRTGPSRRARAPGGDPSGPSRNVPPEIGAADHRRTLSSTLEIPGVFLRVCVLARRRQRPVFRAERHEKTH